MKPSRLTALQDRLPQMLVFVALFSIYLRTLAPGLTWANDGSDGGDLIAAAATGGVAHPTGYPLYLLVARLFQWLPVGTLAYRTNLLSALAMALAAVLVTGLVVQSLPAARPFIRWLAGLSAGLAFGMSPLAWSQAVITEVYALQALLTALVICLYAMPDAASKYLNITRGLVLGLAIGNHVTALLLVPAALLAGSLQRRDTPQPGGGWRGRYTFQPAALGGQLLGLALGLTLYLLLPLRALGQPAIDWGGVTSLDRFWWLVSGRLYQNYYLGASVPELWERIQAFAAVLVRQFGLAGMLLGLLGILAFGTRSRLAFLTVWTVIAYSAFAISYRSADSYLYLLPVLLAFSVWVGQGAGGVLQSVAHRSVSAAFFLGILVTGFFLVRSVDTLREVDASRDQRAESFGRQVLSSAPQNAILFARGDRAVFALWYFHFALAGRPDLAVVAEDLLHFDWYQESLRATYPSLRVPGPFPWPATITRANPERPACTVQFDGGVEMHCTGNMTTP